MAILAALWGRVGPILIAIGAVLLAIVTFGAAQRRAGRQDAAAEATTQTLQNAQVRHDIEDDLRRAGPGAADRLRDQWSRD
ncbi:hypothetical protein [Azospirillum doebereinerae]|uniref:Uncharacterized protein n=1 Tax=Azospirillum doebereinerae TaxID=92933 RepID=A0A3S0VEL0_9PROT|nr:hypothetical protein [Azospirillum doebereinerae]RUQ63975.1 hypothetical protein EJ913_26995 [Azospirillum doebereinerae]